MYFLYFNILLTHATGQATSTGKTISKLIPLLRANKVEDRRNGAATLVTLTLEKEGKMQFHKASASGDSCAVSHTVVEWPTQW